MELVFDKRTEIKLSVYGQTYTLKKPTIKQVKSFESRMKDSSGKEMEMASEFLNELGLPIEVTENLEVDHFSKIVESLMGVKKN